MKKIILLFLLTGSITVWSQPGGATTSGGTTGGGTTVLGQGGGTGAYHFVLYPNPATSSISISLKDDKDTVNIISYIIYNSGGETVISNETEPAKTIQVDLGELESGNYFIQIIFDGIIESCSCNAVIEEFIKE